MSISLSIFFLALPFLLLFYKRKQTYKAVTVTIFSIGLFFAAFTTYASAQTAANLTVTTKTVGSTAYNVVAYIPQGATGELPTFVFIPGLGERGTGSTNVSDLYINGPLKYIKNDGWRPNFVVIGIQPADGWASTSWTHNMLNALLADSSFHVDPDRLYLTGLSAGAYNIFQYIRDASSPVNIAAIVPMSYSWTASANDTRYSNIAVWGLAGTGDSHYAKMKAFVESLAASGYNAKFTSYAGDHCCWNTYYNPLWTENGKSIYDWALQFSRNGGTVPAPQPNQSPTANAGIDQTITLPTSSATLSGFGTDSDGSVSAYAWSQQFGPNTATISSPSAASTTASNLIAGSYRFRLTVTDNQGATAYDDVTVTVQDAPTPPTGGTCPAKNIVVLGSSTAVGTGADPKNVNGWVFRFESYLRTLNPNHDVINLAVNGNTTYNILPTGSVVPSDYTIGTATNITAAVNRHPAAIIINLPTNDESRGVPIAQQQANYEIVAAAAQQANIPLWVTTTQPRNSGVTDAGRQNLMIMRDWITNRFGTKSIDFWTTVANADGTINATYNYDQVHVNNLGHELFYNRTVAEDIIGIVCGTSTGPAPTNQSPTANAGTDKSITLPTSSVTLSGSGTDSDGSIASYAWTKTAGGTASIASPSAATTTVGSLAQGTYTFRLTVTDNQGATATDDVNVVVSAATSSRRIILPVGATNKQIWVPDVTATLGVQPGDTLVVPAGKEIISLLLSNFHGTAQNPIIIEMEDPTTSTIGGYSSYAFNITNATHFIIRNVVVDGKNTSGYGMAISNGTSDYTIENVTIRNTGSGPGLQTKWNIVDNDPSTAYPNTINNVVLRNITVQNTGSEGYYIGHTGSPSVPGMYPMPIANLVAENLTADNTGWDGIQFAGVRNIVATNLKATNFGTEGRRGQQAGIFFGGSTTGSLVGFEAKNGTGAGITIFGRGLITMKNGVLENVATSSTEHGIYVDDYADIELPPLQLNLENININGATLNPVYVKNTNGTMLPGVLKDIFYTNVGAGKKIFDASNSQIIGGTEGGGVMPNALPSANAGADKVITLPINSVTFAGSATDSDGSIATVTWSKISGGNATIANPSALMTTITGLVEGTYTFRLTVTDNLGAIAIDDVVVLVNPVPNTAPAVNAGVDQTIMLPTSTITLTGAAVDAEGDAMTYAWSKTSGGAATIVSPTTISTSINGLSQGAYTFTFTATDSRGAIGTDTVTVTVNGIPNSSPNANAGTDQILTKLVNGSFTLIGTGVDSDGTITSYRWTQISGPTATIVSPTAPTTKVNAVNAGVYIFRLTVTDNLGAVGTDDVSITVQSVKINKNPHVKAATTSPIVTTASELKLAGAATDDDGTIASTEWMQVSGPQASIESPTSLETTVSGLDANTYEFTLTAIDNEGGVATDTVRIIASRPTTSGGGGGGGSSGGGSSRSDERPTVSAGGDQTITLPINSVVLNGTGSDAEGPVSYEWKQVSGHTGGKIDSAHNAKASVTGLTEGRYVFSLAVTDKKGQEAKDEIVVTVLKAPTIPTSVGADNSSRIKVNVQTTLRVRADASITSQVMGYVRGGITGSVIQQKTGPSGVQWLQVQFENGTTGWVSKSYTVPDQSVTTTVSDSNTVTPTRATVTARLLNVRAAAGGAVIGQVALGSGGSVLSDNGSWFRVQFDNGTTGWVSRAYMSTNTTSSLGTITVTATMLNVRSAPNGVLIGKVARGTQGKVLERQSLWVHVQFPEVEGWVSAVYIQ